MTIFYWLTTLEAGGENCCWPSPAQSISDPSPEGLKIIFYWHTTLEVVQIDDLGDV
jgi:hypothetical protein